MPLPQVEGVIAIEGVSAPVTVIRDEWGIPHITATNTRDLFFAQGFVQAQDRLFQMDLWRRASLGRLSEVLGANFVLRDAMTRRMQYRGDAATDWRAHGPDAATIAGAFVDGVNAWIEHSRGQWPDEFRLAGWEPERWQPDDLRNRTDAYVASGFAQDDVLRARMTSALGRALWGRLFVAPPELSAPGVDLSAVTAVLGETVGRVGTRPFFSGFAAPFGVGSNVIGVAGSRSASGGALVAVDPHRRFEAPSARYLVHLAAPGWHVAGATAPWLPGVTMGHNAHLAWAMASAAVDVQDLFVERVNPVNPRQVLDRGRWVDMTVLIDRIPVKGREEPFEFEQLHTAHGVVVGLDAERHLAYTLRWTGTEPGAAAELVSPDLDRATTIDEFRTALGRWRMPLVDVVVADTLGTVAQLRAGLAPERVGFSGQVPADAVTHQREWRSLAGAPRPRAVTDGLTVATNDDPVRASRLRAVLGQRRDWRAEPLAALQRDVHSVAADRLLPLLTTAPLSGEGAEARRRLLAWDRAVTAGSDEAQLFARWERRLRLAVVGEMSSEFAEALADRMSLDDLIAALSRARSGAPAMLASTLAQALDAPPALAGGPPRPQVTFAHPLAISPAAQARFNVGPFEGHGDAHTVQVLTDMGRVGASFRAVFATREWDQSLVINAPGQSAWPDSPHYRDMAAAWAEGRVIPLAFSAEAVSRGARHRLEIQPVTPAK